MYHSQSLRDMYCCFNRTDFYYSLLSPPLLQYRSINLVAWDENQIDKNSHPPPPTSCYLDENNVSSQCWWRRRQWCQDHQEAREAQYEEESQVSCLVHSFYVLPYLACDKKGIVVYHDVTLNVTRTGISTEEPFADINVSSHYVTHCQARRIRQRTFCSHYCIPLRYTLPG